MSIELVKSRILSFLCSSEPEVLAISGRWGTGKTFAWNRFLRDAHKGNAIALQRYAYVSLFGLSSIEELKYSIFENTVLEAHITESPSVDTLREVLDSAEGFGRKFGALLKNIPLIGKHFTTVSPAMFLVVRKQIVCIDDIERRGRDLDIRDVLGLVSFLKEQRACKIAIILNDEMLRSEGSQDYVSYLEKVVDTSLKYLPNPRDSVSIALESTDDTGSLIMENCISLGINNIRLIKKIYRMASELKELVPPATPDEYFIRAVRSLTLLSWAVYEPDLAPSFEYLERRRSYYHGSGDAQANVPVDDVRWNTVLDAYGFTYMDDFDEAILKGVRNGFFDEASIDGYLMDQLSIQISMYRHEAIDQAWWRFHESFDDDEEKVVEGIISATRNFVGAVSTSQLNGFYPVSTDGLKKLEYLRSLLATRRRILAL